MWDQVLVSVALIAAGLLVYEIAIWRARALEPGRRSDPMFQNPRLSWLNDGLTVAFFGVLTGGAILTYFIVTEGWRW